VPMIVMVAFAVLGAVDDWQGIRGPHRGQGMSVRSKFLAQVILGLGTAWVLKFLLACRTCSCPHHRVLRARVLVHPDRGIHHRQHVNAVNFTDGLDGLAGLIAATASPATALSP